MKQPLGATGQSLVEVLIAVVVGTIMVAAAVGAIIPALISNTKGTETQVAAALGKELLENTRVLAEADWRTLYDLQKGSAAPYYLTISTSPFRVATGTENVAVSTRNYGRYFYVEHVCRELPPGDVTKIAGVENPASECPQVPTPSARDASTLKLTVASSLSGAPPRTISTYLLRYRNRVAVQSDWSGGHGEEGPVEAFSHRFSTSSNILYASTTGSLFLGPEGGTSAGGPFVGTNISALATEHWAWNDIVGWINFYETNTVLVFDDKLTGYASSSAGDISLDCATTRRGDICVQSNYWITNDGRGYLAGWAWNDVYGWMSTSCTNHDPTCSPFYRVTIDGVGDFHGYAWNDVIGWISFNCADYGYCGTSNYKVKTDWRPQAASGTLISATFNTKSTSGAQLNSVLWQGSSGGGGVEFQFATSDSPSGPWNFIGSDGTPNTYYTAAPDATIRLSYTLHVNKRYFRYRLRLSDPTRMNSPRVDDIIVNWSP